MHKYRELHFWQISKKLAIEIYRVTEKFPETEKFGLTSQMRRSAVSISSNIAEGSGRRSNKEFIRFLNISMGSLYELETQMEIATEIGVLRVDEHELLQKELTSVAQMMSKFRVNLSYSNS